MAKVGVVLSGCGVFDGSEIHEVLITLLALHRAGAEVVALAPDIELDVVDHYSGNATGDKRNVLTESARLMRGKVKPLEELAVSDIDAIILPGGFGAAKNLCDFAVRGAGATAIPALAGILREAHAAGKPIGAMCIAPVVVAAAFAGEKFSPKLTIGTDPETAAKLNQLGGEHVDCAVDGVVIDREHKIVSTPAYMLGEWVADISDGIEKLVTEVLNLVEN
jgi:enhancing lycopene biosynthesis protein 2